MTLKDYGIHHFTINELVPPEIASAYSESRILQFFDVRIIKAWEWIRAERGNPIYMNTWANESRGSYPSFDGRGLRINTSGSFKTSQHYFGRALDGDEVGVDNRELYEFCLQNQQKLTTMGVTTIESIEYTTTWVHLDCRYINHNSNEIHIVTP